MKTWIVPALTLALTTSSASAGGWFGQRGDCAHSAYGPCARQDAAQAFQRARRLDGMDCANLSSYAEAVRVGMNARIWATIRQPLVGPGAASSTAPLPSLEPPFAPSPKPPAELTVPEDPKPDATR
jgi:hypothetical protein